MRKQDELSDPKSCLNTAEPDEPLFVLKGRDRHAPALVWLWAVLRELDQEPPEVVKEARKCVVSMMLWAKERGRCCVGNGQTVLAGVLELIRCANFAVSTAANVPTNVDFVRMVLNRTEFEKAAQGGDGVQPDQKKTNDELAALLRECGVQPDQKKTNDELAALLRECPANGTLFRHYKAGSLCTVVDSAILEATQEAVVVYQPWNIAITFCRTLREWRGLVEWQGRKVPRFAEA